MADAYPPAYPGAPPGSNYGHHPLPQPPMYRFGPPTANYGDPHASASQGSAPTHSHFSFQPGADAPRYPHDRPLPPRPNPGTRSRDRDIRRRDHRSFRNRNDRASRPQRVATSNRPLLLHRGSQSPEQTMGVQDQNASMRFHDIDDMSDSAEEAMDESDEDHGEGGNQADEILMDGSEDGEIDEMPAKPLQQSLAALARSPSINDNATSSLPKWSNPEPYTALPPEEERRKRRNIVKLIRKARVTAEKDPESAGQAASNDDFISFDFKDEESAEVGAYSPPGASDQGIGPSDGAIGQPVALQTLLQGRSALERPNGEHFSDHNGSVLSNGDSLVEALNESRKRKRSADLDGADDLEAPSYKRANKRFDGGFVQSEWAVTASVNPIPWLVDDASKLSASPGFRLHKEICDFYDFVRPAPFEQATREDLVARLRKIVRDWAPDADVYPFGSFAAGLYLPNADMDMVVISKAYESSGIPAICRTAGEMYKLAGRLHKSFAASRTVEVISKAKVPLIKFVDRVTNLRVDLSFENTTGLTALNTFQTWEAQFPAMPVLVTIVKQFLMMRGLNEVVNGGIGGFSVTCLVTSLLQHLPRVQTGEIRPEQHLGEMLLEFLDFYGNQFDLARVSISMNPPQFLEKSAIDPRAMQKFDRLHIIDPNKSDNDISGGSREVSLIFERFSRAREEILLAMRSPNRKSLLDWMLGGNYGSFLWQRKHLRNLHDEHFGVSVGAQRQGIDAHGPRTEKDEKTVQVRPQATADPGSVPPKSASGVTISGNASAQALVSGLHSAASTHPTNQTGDAITVGAADEARSLNHTVVVSPAPMNSYVAASQASATAVKPTPKKTKAFASAKKLKKGKGAEVSSKASAKMSGKKADGKVSKKKATRNESVVNVDGRSPVVMSNGTANAAKADGSGLAKDSADQRPASKSAGKAADKSSGAPMTAKTNKSAASAKTSTEKQAVKHALEKKAATQRAEAFQALHPDVADVPSEMSKAQFQQWKKKHSPSSKKGQGSAKAATAVIKDGVEAP